MKLNFIESCLSHAKARRISESLEKESDEWRDSYQHWSRHLPPTPSFGMNFMPALIEWDSIAHGKQGFLLNLEDGR